MDETKVGLSSFFLEVANAKVEARGYGISITRTHEKGESPYQSADRLVLKEQRNRKSRYYSWIKSINQKVDVIDWILLI